MDLNQLQQKLLAAARAQPPGDAVPYTFEQRILARLTGQPVADAAVWWVRGLWQAAASCAALCVLLGAWTLVNPSFASAEDELAQQFESTVFAAMEEDAENTW
jgi:hypothetical protein